MKSDIFFFITSVSVVVISILLVILLVYGFQIVRDVRIFVRTVKDEGEEIVKDFRAGRMSVMEKGKSIVSVLSTFFRYGAKHKERKKKSHTESE